MKKLCMKQTPVSVDSFFFDGSRFADSSLSCLSWLLLSRGKILGWIQHPHPTTGPHVLSPSWVNRNLTGIMSYSALLLPMFVSGLRHTRNMEVPILRGLDYYAQSWPSIRSTNKGLHFNISIGKLLCSSAFPLPTRNKTLQIRKY